MLSFGQEGTDNDYKEQLHFVRLVRSNKKSQPPEIE